MDAYSQIVHNFRESRWEPSELNGGKLCEVVYCVLRGYVDGKFPAKAKKPRNMADACKALEAADSNIFPRSVRIQIPRMIVALYEVRNNRGVGHVGGDVDPNHMDARYVLESAKWVMAELVRIFHDLDPRAATETVDGLVDRTVPVVWEVGERKRVLNAELSKKKQTLLLLYSTKSPISVSDLLSWVEHSSLSAFRRDVLWPAHHARLIEYDSENGIVFLSPAGIAYVEENLPLDA
ncbi:MAG: hypothetical protein HZB57_02730 [Gammaproteobacteria bacterium]|nr:hypothetical protein [Gammaproteobacteria bacterium]